MVLARNSGTMKPAIRHLLLLLGLCPARSFQLSSLGRIVVRTRQRPVASARPNDDEVFPPPRENLPTDALLDVNQNDQKTRRLFLATGLVATGAILGDPSEAAQAVAADYSLPWEANPVNKRSGVTVFDAEKSGYNVAFVTYLSRFLLNYDSDCQKWWFSTRIPRASTADEIEQIRINQFAAFSASVEVGLLGFKGKDGARLLLEDLVQRYGTPPAGDLGATGEDVEAAIKTQRRWARSARRQIALLFGLLEDTQPTQELTKLLASVDNGSVQSVQLLNETFSGYEMGKEPIVEFPPPQAGENYEPAQGRAILKSTGKLLRVDVVDAGSGYSTAPTVTITPPRNGGTPAKAKAKLVSQGPNKGSIDSIRLIDSGSGYMDREQVNVNVSPPDLNKGRVANLTPILDAAIDRIEITKTGSGYAVEKPLKVFVQAPKGDKQGEPRLVGQASAAGERSSFTALRPDSDKQKLYQLEADFESKYNLKPPTRTVSGIDNSDAPSLPFWSGKSTSAELLRLLPSGIGLEYDIILKRYTLAADTDFLNKYPAAVQQSSNRRIFPEFGPRGRAPIERNMQLGPDTYWRFGLSGAICAAGVHLALTPLDVVKTKVQVDPVKYPDIGSSFKTIFGEEGAPTLFTGWLPTVLGNFAAGGVLYAATEIIRRSLSEAAGVDAVSLEVPIILAAAGVASAVGAVIICPFEAVRIRTVAQPGFADNSIEVLTKMLQEEGLAALINAIPVFLARNVPYAMTKFTIFDLSTERMYEAFPAAQEDFKLSLLVSLIGGILGGTAAAIISNPADAVISELKKAKSDISPLEAVNNMLERAGSSAFFVGLPLRIVFYSLTASLTFVVYDSVRFALGIGTDDLKLYLDVLGGALQNGPPA